MNRLPFWFRFVVAFLLFVVMPACALPGLGRQPAQENPAGPVVTVTSPTAGQQVSPGKEIQVLSTAVDPDGIARTELWVNGQVVWVDANARPEPNTPFIVAQPWVPEHGGTYQIQVRAYDTGNVAGESAVVPVEVVVLAQAVEASSPTPAPAANTATPAASSGLVDAPTATFTPPPTPTLPANTPTPAPPTPTPTVTPTPGSFSPTGLEPEGRFYEVWQQVGAGSSRLGYPTGPEIGDRNFARQYFDKGVMYWWDNPGGTGDIWVLDSPRPDFQGGATWNRYADEWDGREEYSCHQARANGGLGPLRGFGWLWCTQPGLQDRLGNPRLPEAGSGGNPPFGRVQFFQGGVMLYNPIEKELFVLFNQGDWQRFGG